MSQPRKDNFNENYVRLIWRLISTRLSDSVTFYSGSNPIKFMKEVDSNYEFYICSLRKFLFSRFTDLSRKLSHKVLILLFHAIIKKNIVL